MSPLAEVPQGIPFSADEIRSALETVAIPGYTGSIQLQVVLAPEAAKYISIVVIRRQVSRVDQAQPAVRQVLPDPSRKKPVESVIADIKGRLRIRTVLTALEVQVTDGVLQKQTIQE